MRNILKWYHERTAIWVTLSAWTGGTAVFTPASGTSYSLSSLPVGTEIYKSTDTLYTLFDANGNDVWTITLAASSWYNVDEVTITRWWVKTTIDIIPIVLQEWDSIVADFEATTMRIRFYNNSLWTFYNELTGQYIPDWYVAEVPRADVLRFSPYGTTNWIIEIYKDWVWISVVDYTYNWQQAYIFAESSWVWQTRSIDFVPGPGTTYVFPAMWSLQDWYQYLDGSTFALQNPPVACALVDYQTAWLESTDYLKEYFMDNVLSRTPEFSSVTQVMDWIKPDGWLLNYVLYDTGIMAGMFYLDIVYMTLSWQYQSTRIFVPFTYDWWHMNCYPYEDGYSSWLFVPRQNTNLNRPDTGLIGGIFWYWDANALGYWMSMWQCSDECDFIMKISALANWYYQNL